MKTKLDVQSKVQRKRLHGSKNELITLLNEALSEEWLTYYQSWIGAILMEGPLKDQIKPELFIHANQELNHALSLKERLQQLGGYLIQNSTNKKTQARCQAPTNNYIEDILNKNLENERCAIQRYQQIADYAFEKDQTTYQLICKILDEELIHVQEIEDWLTEIYKSKEEVKNVTSKYLVVA
jgi:bacterioferritin